MADWCWHMFCKVNCRTSFLYNPSSKTHGTLKNVTNNDTDILFTIKHRSQRFFQTLRISRGSTVCQFQLPYWFCHFGKLMYSWMLVITGAPVSTALKTNMILFNFNIRYAFYVLLWIKYAFTKFPKHYILFINTVFFSYLPMLQIY